MNKKMAPNYWVFSNYPEGTYIEEELIWDMRTIIKTNKYSIYETERNRANVRLGDIVYMRVYRQAFIGKFNVGGIWEQLPADPKVGTFSMKNVEIWRRPLPQWLVMGDLSNRDHRSRIIKITREDGIIIETAQRVYARLGFSGSNEEVVILEKGLEEAIKHSLDKLDLKLAGEDIRQQFDMGIGVGRSDLICTDKNGDFVVIEIKRGMTSDQVVGQVLSYVGYMKENLAKEGQEVHACIITGDYDERLRLAAMAANIRLVLVRLG